MNTRNNSESLPLNGRVHATRFKPVMSVSCILLLTLTVLTSSTSAFAGPSGSATIARSSHARASSASPPLPLTSNVHAHLKVRRNFDVDATQIGDVATSSTFSTSLSTQHNGEFDAHASRSTALASLPARIATNHPTSSATTASFEDSTAVAFPKFFQHIVEFLSERAPGVTVSIALAHISMSVASTSLGKHVSPLLWATILGTVYGNFLHRPKAAISLGTGIKFAKGRLLRLGIILYGFKVTLQQIAGIGMAGVATDVTMVCSTLALALVLGQRWLGLDLSTSTLIGSGAAICGCSAVLATQPVVGGESHEVSAAVGTVVLGGTLSMFLYPFLYRALPFLANSPKLMGIYTGSTIHEIAGVVAAGNAMGSDVAYTAVVTKLARVLLLAPVLTTLSWLQQRRQMMGNDSSLHSTFNTKSAPTLPYFAFAFVAVSAFNSIFKFPAPIIQLAGKTSTFSLLCAMAALGIDSDFQAIRKLGSKPLILAAALWTWLAVGGLGIASLFVGAI